MRRLTKKIAASALALSLVFTMGTQCFAANWGSYFGGSEGWYEGAEGTLTSNTDKAWTAQMASIGYGGVWGAQVYKNGISVKKGQQYTLSFDAQSSTCDKWVYVKVSTDETLAFSDWVQLKKGSTTKYSTTFTAKANAKSVYFGIGGEFGDRTEEQGDIYALSEVLPNDADSSFSTSVKVTNFKCVKSKAKLKVTKDKKKNGIALYNYLKKNGKIFKQVGDFVCTIQTSGNKIQIKAIQNQEVVADVKLAKNKPQATVKKLRSNIASSAINSALKTETKMTLKNLGY